MKALKDTWPVVVSILTATGFLWLNDPTKSDFDKLESKVSRLESRMATKEDLRNLETRLESKMTTLESNMTGLESKMTTKEDFRNLETTITTAMTIYRDEVKQVKNELQKHTLNYAAHK